MTRLVRWSVVFRVWCTLGYLCLSVRLIGAPPATHESFLSLQSQLEHVRSWMDEGHYEQAEAEAERVLAMLGDSTQAASERIVATDLLVEARVRNGRSAESRTRALAEQVVRVRTTLSG